MKILKLWENECTGQDFTQDYPRITKTKEGEDRICSNQHFSKGLDYIIRGKDKLLFRIQKEKPKHAIVSFKKNKYFHFKISIDF